MSTRIRALHAAHSTPVPFTQPQPSYFVMRRDGGDWTAGASIIAVTASEADATQRVTELQRQFPHGSFGIATLTSETRTVTHTELVRVAN